MTRSASYPLPAWLRDIDGDAYVEALVFGYAAPVSAAAASLLDAVAVFFTGSPACAVLKAAGAAACLLLAALGPEKGLRTGLLGLCAGLGAAMC